MKSLMYKTACFIGHREIFNDIDFNNKLYRVIENLILVNGVNVFMFGSKSRFNSLCYRTVTELKEKYPYTKRIYVRAEYPKISEEYKNYLLENYEETYYPENILKCGKAIYIKRNFEMIDKSEYCIFYYDKNKNRKSGTESAYRYALKKDKVIINTFN